MVEKRAHEEARSIRIGLEESDELAGERVEALVPARHGFEKPRQRHAPVLHQMLENRAPEHLFRGVVVEERRLGDAHLVRDRLQRRAVEPVAGEAARRG